MKGEPERAARVFGAFETLREGVVMNGKLDPADRMDYEHYVALARAQLDEAPFEAAWAKGRAMTLDQAVECA